MNIRICTPNDYASAVAIRNTLYPNRPTTMQAWLEGDQQRKPEYKRQVLGFVRQPDWLQMEKNCPPPE